jgi:hypothetical protein
MASQRLCLVQWEPFPLWVCLLGVIRKGYWSCFLLLKMVDLLKIEVLLLNQRETLILEAVALAGVKGFSGV